MGGGGFAALAASAESSTATPLSSLSRSGFCIPTEEVGFTEVETAAVGAEGRAGGVAARACGAGDWVGDGAAGVCVAGLACAVSVVAALSILTTSAFSSEFTV